MIFWHSCVPFVFNISIQQCMKSRFTKQFQQGAPCKTLIFLKELDTVRPKHNGHNIQNKISNWFCWKKIFDLWLINSSLEFVQLCNIAAIHPCVYSWLKNATFKKRWMQSRWYWLLSCQLVIVCSCMYICHWHKLVCALACSMVSTMSLSELMDIYNSLKTWYENKLLHQNNKKVMLSIQKIFFMFLPENSGCVCYMVLLAIIAQ